MDLYRNRRRLLDALGGNMAVIRSRGSDSQWRCASSFRQESDLFYLTGFEPDARWCCARAIPVRKLRYCPPRDPSGKPGTKRLGVDKAAGCSAWMPPIRPLNWISAWRISAPRRWFLRVFRNGFAPGCVAGDCPAWRAGAHSQWPRRQRCRTCTICWERCACARAEDRPSARGQSHHRGRPWHACAGASNEIELEACWLSPTASRQPPLMATRRSSPPAQCHDPALRGRTVHRRRGSGVD